MAVLLLLIGSPYIGITQVSPAEGLILNYRVIGFSVPAVGGATTYTLDIADGSYPNETEFRKHVTISVTGTSNKIIGKVPAFGGQYTWAITAAGKNVVAPIDEIHHFSTGISPDVDTNNTRLRVMRKAAKYKDAHVFVDGNSALYDMQGQPVWYLPNSVVGGNIEVRDLKLTSVGTITFLAGETAYEIGYNGNVLWKSRGSGAGNGDTTDHYHHEVTRLKNGHYMLLGNEYVADAGAAPGAEKKPFGTVVEYNAKGNLAWSWKSSVYFAGSDIYNRKDAAGQPKVNVHENSFYFDEKERVVYLSFKNISRILKIAYPGGNVLNAWGEVFKEGMPGKGNGLFSEQHGIKKVQHGYLALFNNNMANIDAVPKLIIMQEPTIPNGALKKVWEFDCPVAKVNGKKPQRGILTSGGNIMELPDNSLFATMCHPYWNLFIVGRNKQLLWEAQPEKWNKVEQKWLTASSYRGSIIVDKKEFENLVWGGSPSTP